MNWEMLDKSTWGKGHRATQWPQELKRTSCSATMIELSCSSRLSLSVVVKPQRESQCQGNLRTRNILLQSRFEEISCSLRLGLSLVVKLHCGSLIQDNLKTSWFLLRNYVRAQLFVTTLPVFSCEDPFRVTTSDKTKNQEVVLFFPTNVVGVVSF